MGNFSHLGTPVNPALPCNPALSVLNRYLCFGQNQVSVVRNKVPVYDVMLVLGGYTTR